MKYKIGEKVRIVSKAPDYNFVDSMNKYLGTIMTIRYEGKYGKYFMEEDGGTWSWDDSMIADSVGMPLKQSDIPSDYEKSIKGMIDHCSEVLLQKHKEYASEDDFHNFNVAAELQAITPEQALIGMMDKHVVSVHDLVNNQAEGREIPAETWSEKIGDNINYLLILWAMVSSKAV